MNDAVKTTARNILGRVKSTGMDKTVSVLVERRIKHPLYGKYIRRSTKILAHDEANECEVGDVVQIAPSRPYSKRKSWRVVQIASHKEGLAAEDKEEGAS